MTYHGRIKLISPNVTLATPQIVTHIRSGPDRPELTGMAFWPMKKRSTCLLSFMWSHMFQVQQAYCYLPQIYQVSLSNEKFQFPISKADEILQLTN